MLRRFVLIIFFLVSLVTYLCWHSPPRAYTNPFKGMRFEGCSGRISASPPNSPFSLSTRWSPRFSAGCVAGEKAVMRGWCRQVAPLCAYAHLRESSAGGYCDVCVRGQMFFFLAVSACISVSASFRPASRESESTSLLESLVLLTSMDAFYLG